MVAYSPSLSILNLPNGAALSLVALLLTVGTWQVRHDKGNLGVTQISLPCLHPVNPKGFSFDLLMSLHPYWQI